MITRRAHYCPHAFESQAAIVRRAKAALADAPEFDTVVGTGLSGTLVVPVLGRGLRKRWAIIRKANDGSHAHSRLEGQLGDRWLFVDDFIATGATLKRTCDAVNEIVAQHNADVPWCESFVETHPNLVGAYLYEKLRDPHCEDLGRFDDLAKWRRYPWCITEEWE